MVAWWRCLPSSARSLPLRREDHIIRARVAQEDESSLSTFPPPPAVSPRCRYSRLIIVAASRCVFASHTYTPDSKTRHHHRIQFRDVNSPPADKNPLRNLRTIAGTIAALRIQSNVTVIFFEKTSYIANFLLYTESSISTLD